MPFEAPVLTIEPSVLIAGDTVIWNKALTQGEPGDGALKYYFNNPTANKSIGPIVATDNGDGTFLVTLDANVSAPMDVGDWKWEAYFYPTNTTQRFRVGFGRTCVKANYAALQGGAGVDDRSHVEKTLDAIEATIAGKATQDQLMYSIHGRTLQRMSFKELESFRKDYKRQLAAQRDREKIANGKHPTTAIKVRFGGGMPSSFPFQWPWWRP